MRLPHVKLGWALGLPAAGSKTQCERCHDDGHHEYYRFRWRLEEELLLSQSMRKYLKQPLGEQRDEQRH
ncbi:hypothetical protein [Mumia zhuanghuii]|uniref:Uncharacterized protein n=1 Tax=Mumia zhuanghuii TaxID=2585211 RepID=A0A5C4M593_9ACTN|nr:hypothetical protein [Mumia zhuanghuii]TNC28425.1 hypothetical protein FHE65_33940 [Mumia zhuanghuii]